MTNQAPQAVREYSTAESGEAVPAESTTEDTGEKS